MRAAVALLPRGAVAAQRAALRMPPRLRRAAAITLAAVAALALAWFGWFRDSSFVAIEKVEVSGLSTPEAPRIEAALTAVARDMTTLHLSQAELEEAVEPFPVVRSIEAVTDFPHGVRIRVVEHRPVAVLAVAGDRIPLAADGTLLRGMPASDRLPRIGGTSALMGDRLARGPARTMLDVAAAAPRRLTPRIERIGAGRRRGIVVALRDGPLIVFGSAERARAKWLAAAAVLADPSAKGATYVDVRIAERPTAGGLPVETIDPVAPAGATVQPEATAPPGTAAPQAGAPQPDTGQAGTAPETAAPQPGATAPPASGQPPPAGGATAP